MHVAVVNLTGGGLSGGYRKYLQNVLEIVEDAIQPIGVFLSMGSHWQRLPIANIIQRWQYRVDKKYPQFLDSRNTSSKFNSY